MVTIFYDFLLQEFYHNTLNFLNGETFIDTIISLSPLQTNWCSTFEITEFPILKLFLHLELETKYM